MPPRQRSGPSIEDVARLAGVSAQTVSRVSTGSAPVRPDTRQRVLLAMDKLGYSPNRAARALRSGHFHTLGLLAHRLERTGEALTTGAVREAAEQAGYSVTLMDVRGSEPSEWDSAVHRLASQAIDGLIIIRAEHAIPESLTLPPQLPVAVSDSRLAGHHPAVVADQIQGSLDAVNHLLSLGHSTVHHIAGPADSVPAAVRADGWRSALQQAGATVPQLMRGDWTAKTGYEIGRGLPPDVTSVFCANDETAFGLMRALREAGRDVPRDVSVVGFDDIGLAPYAAPPLTTVRQDFLRIGHDLVALILAQMRGETRGPLDRIVLPTELFVRESTAPPRA